MITAVSPRYKMITGKNIVSDHSPIFATSQTSVVPSCLPMPSSCHRVRLRASERSWCALRGAVVPCPCPDPNTRREGFTSPSATIAAAIILRSGRKARDISVQILRRLCPDGRRIGGSLALSPHSRADAAAVDRRWPGLAFGLQTLEACTQSGFIEGLPPGDPSQRPRARPHRRTRQPATWRPAKRSSPGRFARTSESGGFRGPKPCPRVVPLLVGRRIGLSIGARRRFGDTRCCLRVGGFRGRWAYPKGSLSPCCPRLRSSCRPV